MSNLGGRFFAPGVIFACAAAAGVGFGIGAWHADSGASPLRAEDLQTCSAFAAVDHLVHESMDPDPTPGDSTPRSYDLVGAADALNNTRHWQSSSTLRAAVTSYVYSLANLGAVINAHESEDDIASMHFVAKAAANTVITVCQEQFHDFTAASARAQNGAANADPGSITAPEH